MITERERIEIELERFFSQSYVDPKQRIKGDSPLSPREKQIMELISLGFGTEMEKFAKSLAKGWGYDEKETVQDALLACMAKRKWESFDPNKAGDGGFRSWYRRVYRRDILDAHDRMVREQCRLRLVPLEPNWHQDEDENYW